MTAKRKDESGKKANIPEIVSLESLVSRSYSKKISEAQEFQLELISRTNFNFCNGKLIAELLIENYKMWRAALMPLDLLSLRDLENGCWHADTLYIYAEEGCQHSLDELVREQFNADEIHWIGNSDAADMLGVSELEGSLDAVLSVWWD